MWIGGGGSEWSGEYDCAHRTALYNTHNKKCLPESPLLLLVLFFWGAARRASMRNQGPVEVEVEGNIGKKTTDEGMK